MIIHNTIEPVVHAMLLPMAFRMPPEITIIEVATNDVYMWDTVSRKLMPRTTQATIISGKIKSKLTKALVNTKESNPFRTEPRQAGINIKISNTCRTSGSAK